MFCRTRSTHFRRRCASSGRCTARRPSRCPTRHTGAYSRPAGAAKESLRGSGVGSVKAVGRATVIAGMALVFATQTAAAATAKVLATVSNPYHNCTIGSGPPEWGTVNYANAEVEPMVAVNPANHRNIIG